MLVSLNSVHFETGVSVYNATKRSNLEDLGVEERIILKWILKNRVKV